MPEISIAQFLQLDPKPQLVDVREDYEWQGGRLEGAVHIPLSQLVERKSEVEPEAVLYCRSGKRSARGMELLQSEGLSLQSLAGGIVEWEERGLPVEKPEGLSETEYRRYSRHLLLSELGISGQLKLKHSKVLLIGAGGLGAPVAQYLAAAGVGTLGIVDDDVVELSNLQRQVIHSTDRLGQAKADSAETFIHSLNPEVEVRLYRTRLDRENVWDVVGDYSIIVDGTDNFPTRYLLSDVAVRLNKTVVSASILGFDGQLTVFAPNGPCYRCLYPTPPPPEMAPSCSENGVLGAMAGVVGTLQAVEVVKLIVGVGDPLVGRLLVYDALTPDFRLLKVKKRPDCEVCGLGADLSQPLPDYVDFCNV